MTTTKATFTKYPAYKDSGVDWLGNIPEDWALGKLGTLLKPVSIKGQPDLPLLSITRELGVIERNLDEDEGNHNFIPDDLSGYKVIQEGQFGMNKMKAWQGSYGISRFTGIVSPAYYVFDFTSEIDPSFFHYAIRSKNYVAFFGRASDGVRIGQWDLSKSRMKAIPFFIPTSSEQTAIANFLDDKTTKIDRAIAQKEQLIALLKERKQIIIQNAVTKGLDPNGKLKDSGVEWIGEIPEHWEVKKVKHCAHKISKGTTPSTEGRSILDSGIVRFIKAENIQDGIITDNPEHFIDEKTNEIIGRSKLKTNDILFVIAGATLGKVAIVSEKELPANTNQAVSFIRPNKVANPNYLMNWLTSSFIRKVIWLEAVQSAQPNLSMEDLGNLPFISPTVGEQEQILNYIETKSAKIDQAISLQQTQIEKLKEYKATLIDSAVTGKIKVC